MGKYTGVHFENPYLNDGEEHKPSASVVMDDARQKWRSGSWRADPSVFRFKREQLTEDEDKDKKSRPSSDRFKLDVKKDLMGDAISLSALRELDYSPSYRPKGNLDEELLVRPMSTSQRYDVLAGELEAPPEDMSFLRDADVRRARRRVRDGSLRRESRRLDKSVDERRSEVIRMLPDDKNDQSKKIVAEARLRREQKEAQLAKKKKKKKQKETIIADNPLLDEDTRTRLEALPKQEGFDESTQELPEFESQTRYWSRISPDATWSEVSRHTVSTIPEDIDVPRRRPHYAPDEDEQPVYGRIRLNMPRARLRSNTVGSYENEYLRQEGVDIDRVRQIMEHKYRGRWIPPDFFSDDNLVHEWFTQFSRGNVADEDFVHWAYRQRRMADELRMSEMQARIERMQRRQPTDGRRGSHYIQPPPQFIPLKRDNMMDMFGDAHSAGYRYGEDIVRQQAESQKKAAQKRAAQKKTAQKKAEQKKAEQRARYEADLRRAQEQARQQAQSAPFGYPYGGYPQYGAPPEGSSAQYQGMYPDLFAGKSSQPEGYRPPENPMKNYQPQPSPFDERGRRKKKQ